MASGKGNERPRHKSLADFALHGAGRRAPDGRKLAKKERLSVSTLTEINKDVFVATQEVATYARVQDTVWLLYQFLNPINLARQQAPKIPSLDFLMQVIAFLESQGASGSKVTPKKKLSEALTRWYAAMWERPNDPRWKQVLGKPVTLAQFQNWRKTTERMQLSVIPTLEIPSEFNRALSIVSDWETILSARGDIGETFSLREEVTRLHNWPGDQWDSGDDFASAQKRFHRRLRRARHYGIDNVRDRIMLRALYLREGLLLNPVNQLDWFLAVCHFRWLAPSILDIRPTLTTWKVLDWISHLGDSPRNEPNIEFPERLFAKHPRDIPSEDLIYVQGPDLMIDLDEDVVTALPPGCRVRRLVLSARGSLGPDWIVYWVESEWDDSRPIIDLVESAKLHPSVLFVSDEKPDDLAEIVRPFLDDAYEIPTNPLTAHSHIPGVIPQLPNHFDAGL